MFLKILQLIFVLLVLIICTGVSQTPVYVSDYADNRPLKINGIKILRDKVEKYGLFEIILDLQGKYNNPFDPEEIDINCIFIDPDGNEIKVPAFFYQDYERKIQNNVEILNPVGKPHFRVRFSPTKVGNYKFYIIAKDKTNNVVKSDLYSFTSLDSKKSGYIRVSSSDFRYFEFENGDPFIPIGANICWAGGRGTFDYETWLPEYAKVGCNYFRVWLGPSWTTFAIERSSIREYDLKNSWRLDYLLNYAEKMGFYIMLCFDSYNELRYRKEEAYGMWESTPHYIQNGGILKEPKEFWSNEEMQRLYRNKIRYLVSRYGYSTNVFAWEFWNEIDIISPSAYIPELVKDWHSKMSNYLKSVDPWKHLVTTSFSGSSGKPEIDSLSGIDFVQTHIYQGSNYIKYLIGLFNFKSEYKKPHIVGEFGLDAGGRDPYLDPKGFAIHNAIWTTLLSGYAGSAMSWWWDNHIHPDNLYFHYKALSDFISGVNFPKENFKTIESYKFVNTDRDIRLIGLKGEKNTLIWLYDNNVIYNYKKDIPKILLTGPNFLLKLDNLNNGTYKVIYWDTYNSKSIKEEIIEVKDNIANIEVPNFERDIAIRIEFLK